MEYLLAGFAQLRKDLKLQRAVVTEDDLVSLCPGLRHDRLCNPSEWRGYRQFISAIPPERGQLVHDDWSDHYLFEDLNPWQGYTGASFAEHSCKYFYYSAYHYPADPASSTQRDTIYRWELILAWEMLRQVALTRTFLLCIAERKDLDWDWIGLDTTTLSTLREWVSLAKSEFERLENYLFLLGHYEASGVHIGGWFEEMALPDRMHTIGFLAKPTLDFPCEIFRRCKSVLCGKDAIPTTASTNVISGTIRALVQRFHQHLKLVGVEPAPLSWWRTRVEETRARITEESRQSRSCRHSESVLGLDVTSLHAKEVDRWLLPPALRSDESGVSRWEDLGNPGHDVSKIDKSEEAGIPQSNSAQKLDREIGGIS